MGTVERIFIASTGGEPMVPVDEVCAVADRGLNGDRYLAQRGYWSGWDDCQVTLIEGEVLDRIAAGGGPPVGNGEHRRNLVVRGVELAGLAGRRFRIGEAVLEYDRPRPPCRYIESLTEPGMTRALGARRGGICTRVVESGTIRVGDDVEVLDEAAPPRPELRLRPGPVLRRS
jgi:MOSC domain-containing protein YiiM